MTDQPPPTHAAEDGPWRSSGALQALRAAVDASSRLRRVLARRAGLSDSELVAVQHLMAQPLGPAEVARRLEVTPAAITSVVDRLVGHGHVERRAHPTDRRRSELTMTDSGRRDVLDLLLPMFRGLAEVDRGYTDAERAVVQRYLTDAAAALERVADQAVEQAVEHVGEAGGEAGEPRRPAQDSRPRRTPS